MTPFRSRRDHRFDHASDALDHIEETSCRLGCRRGAKSPAEEIDAGGPGGQCSILLDVLMGDGNPIPELSDDGDRVVCLVREPLDA